MTGWRKAWHGVVLLATGSVLVLVAACTTSPTGREQLVVLPDDQMNSMGRQQFKQIKQEKPVERNPAVNRYVRCVALAVARQAEDDTGVSEWEVVVFKDDTANAFALPGGKIGVHTGLLGVAETPDQLAAVLGHEVGHVIARHGNERVSQALGVQLGLATASAAMGDSENRGLVLGALGLGAQYGVLLPYGRTQESEADTIGQRLMAEAGFDPRAAVQLWRNMEQAGGQSPPEFLSTHPSHSSRIRALQRGVDDALPLYRRAQNQGRSPDCPTP